MNWFYYFYFLISNKKTNDKNLFEQESLFSAIQCNIHKNITTPLYLNIMYCSYEWCTG